MSFYLFLLSRDIDFLATLINQNLLFSDSPFLVLSQLGPFLFLIPFAFYSFKKNRQNLFLFVWLVVHLLFSYFPVVWQRRFIEGWWISASFLSSLGLFYLWQKWKPRRLSFLFLSLVIFSLSLAGNLSVLLVETYLLPQREGNVYVSQKEAAAWQSLVPFCDFSKVVLTDWPRGSYLPAKTGCRTLIGHHIQTPDFSHQLMVLEKITKGEMDSVELEKFLKKEGVDYVFLPKNEAQMANLSEVKNFNLFFENEEFMVYGKN